MACSWRRVLKGIRPFLTRNGRIPFLFWPCCTKCGWDAGADSLQANTHFARPQVVCVLLAGCLGIEGDAPLETDVADDLDPELVFGNKRRIIDVFREWLADAEEAQALKPAFPGLVDDSLDDSRDFADAKVFGFDRLFYRPHVRKST